MLTGDPVREDREEHTQQVHSFEVQTYMKEKIKKGLAIYDASRQRFLGNLSANESFKLFDFKQAY